MSAESDFLVLEARFVAGTYGGIEWPPSPFRLLQAIVAGCRGIDAAGLDWLERQLPPLILACDEPAVVRFRRSIPNNADPRKPNSAFSMRSIHLRRVEQPVRYIFPICAADRSAALMLIAAAEEVHTLGVGEDMCVLRGEIVGTPPQSDAINRLWQAQASGGIRRSGEVLLRVPVAGSLASLERRFQAFQRRLNAGEEGYARPVTPPALHRVVAYRPSDQSPRSAYLAFKLLQPDDDAACRRFHPEDAVVVGGMLRHAAMRLADREAPALSDFAAGYAPQQDAERRLSWVPVPSVGHQHADGLIRRALWVARAVDADALGQLAAAIPADGLSLIDAASGECVARALPVDPGEEPVLGHLEGPARDWVSITPLILPGDYGGGNIRLMTRLLHKAVREAGIDVGLLEQVEFSKTGFLRQAARLSEVRLKDWKAKNLILYHVRLRFRTALHGPIVLGRGRHYGLGLMCADLK
ncbi:type I-U CRISPR-associated protein Csb2 [Rhodocyclus purpureus]|uniref:type I-G CRISPR-associated protein Csb2 n=1 Tax=Rhodocyclus purpureus TaxID=1067 RepID=UPI00191470BC|nr:type I-U CRISPR-associated protein Csb2 [Rhodocyclus purpureus]MBK5914356.1 type I-U CRISPR-associated protein Cas5/Cas6 [Rhodocyclus purpureus]